MALFNIPNYILASLLTSLGGFLNGYDTGAIGGITAMPQFAATMGALSPTMHGFTVSLIMLTGAVPSVFAGYLADRLGRVKVIIMGAVLFVLGAVLQGSAATLSQFLVGRGLAGLGEGVYLSTMAVYICEIAPARTRGMLAGLPQFLCNAGICVGYFTCYGSVRMEGSMSWRLPYVAQGIIGALFAGGCFVLPDSPRWLMLHGKRPEAVRVLERLDFGTAEAERDVLRPSGSDQQLSLSMWQGFVLLFRRGYRARTILALFVLGMVQLSGIDAVIYYAPKLFQQAGLSSELAAFLASGVSAILMLAISIPAFLLADKWGRRTSAISGGLGLTGCMFLMGTLYATGAVNSSQFARWTVIVSVFVFGLTYCATWGIVGKIYASEIQPGHTRAAANCVAQGLGFFTNWLVAMIAPILLDTSAFGAYFLFGGLALGTVAVLALYMPETRGRSLEDIQGAFKRPAFKSFKEIAHSVAMVAMGQRPPPTRRTQASRDDEIELASSGSTTSGSVRGLRIEVAS